MKQYFLGFAKRLGNTVLAAIGSIILIALSIKFWEECGRIGDHGLLVGAFVVGFFAFSISVFAMGCTIATLSYALGWMDEV